MNCYTTDLDHIHDALLNANVDDIETIGNALTALVLIVSQQQKEIAELNQKLQNRGNYDQP